MRRLAAALAILALATPACADTLEEIATRGMVITLPDGLELDLTFAADGTYTGLDGGLRGRWRIEGDKLCTTSNLDPNERCEAYPKGKKAGDTFEADAPEGHLKFRIK